MLQSCSDKSEHALVDKGVNAFVFRNHNEYLRPPWGIISVYSWTGKTVGFDAICSGASTKMSLVRQSVIRLQALGYKVKLEEVAQSIQSFLLLKQGSLLSIH